MAVDLDPLALETQRALGPQVHQFGVLSDVCTDSCWREGDTWVLRWDQVTCPTCLAIKGAMQGP